MQKGANSGSTLTASVTTHVCHLQDLASHNLARVAPPSSCVPSGRGLLNASLGNAGPLIRILTALNCRELIPGAPQFHSEWRSACEIFLLSSCSSQRSCRWLSVLPREPSLLLSRQHAYPFRHRLLQPFFHIPPRPLFLLRSGGNCPFDFFVRCSQFSHPWLPGNMGGGDSSSECG